MKRKEIVSRQRATHASLKVLQNKNTTQRPKTSSVSAPTQKPTSKREK